MSTGRRRKSFMWSTGMFVAYYPWAPGHSVMDTGMQLLTSCGQRVTLYGASVDRNVWVQAERLGCFEYRPSPLIEWSQPSP